MAQTLVHNAYVEACRKRGEPAWLVGRRADAWQAASDLALPKLEKTIIERWGLEKVLPGTAPTEGTPLSRDSKAGASLVTVNGWEQDAHIDQALRTQGVLLMSLERAVAEHPEIVEPYLLTRPLAPDHLLAALHRTYLQGGHLLYVPAGVEIDLPVEMVSALGGQDAYPHTLVVLERGARATLVHTELSIDESPIGVNSAVEAYLGEGAFLRYAVVQKLASQVRAFQPRLAHLDRDARIEWIVVQAGGGRVVTTNQTLLEGEGASAESYAVFLGAGHQILDFQTKMNHLASHTTSDIDSKGVMTDEAKAAYTGFTEIRKGAHGCASWQKEKPLMLSDSCRVDLIPALWIYDDDVQKAGHAAAAGQVNPEQLYYLMSRGIRQKDALLLLVTGFLATILDRIPLAQIRDQIAELAKETIAR